jgi:hypothetical protein
VVRGPRPPYGFAYTEDGNGLVVSEPEMGVMRRIFQMIGVEGQTIGGVQRRLNDEGIPSPMANDPHQNNSGMWGKPTVRNLVLNDLYRPLTVEEIAASTLVSATVLARLDSEQVYGLWTYGKRHQEMWRERSEEGEPRDRYETVPKPRDEWLAVPISLSDADLSRADVDAARECISSNTRRPPSTAAGRFWQLSGGIVRCRECGCVLSPKSRRRPSGKVDSWYTCRQRRTNGSTWDCPHTRMYRADVLENSVWEAVWKLLTNPEHMLRQYDRYIERHRGQMRGNPDKEAQDLFERLQKLKRRRSRYLDLAADGVITSREELRAKLAEVDEQREALQKALRQARDRQETIQRLQQNRKTLETTLERFAARRGLGLAHLGPEDRRQVLQALRLQVLVNKHGDVGISGVFDSDITEVLVKSFRAPLSWPPTEQHREIVRPSFQGDITVVDNRRRPAPKVLGGTRMVDTPYRSLASGGCERIPARS